MSIESEVVLFSVEAISTFKKKAQMYKTEISFKGLKTAPSTHSIHGTLNAQPPAAAVVLGQYKCLEVGRDQMCAGSD